MRFKRLQVVIFAVACGTVAFAAPSEAVDSPVAVIVVPCESDVAVNSLMDAPAGVYVATVVGACTPDKDNQWGGPQSTPCSTTTTGPIPCATAGVSNLPGLACWTAFSAATVSTCGPGTSAGLSSCGNPTSTVTVDGQCLSTVPGAVGQVFHAAPPFGTAPFTARFEDSIPAADNFGYFLVLLRPAV